MLEHGQAGNGLSRDPQNPLFPDEAIKVSVFDPSAEETFVEFIGYLEHDLAAAVAPLIDSNQLGICCTRSMFFFQQKYIYNTTTSSIISYAYDRSLEYLQCHAKR